jgi:hypothetical protein
VKPKRYTPTERKIKKVHQLKEGKKKKKLVGEPMSKMECSYSESLKFLSRRFATATSSGKIERRMNEKGEKLIPF